MDRRTKKLHFESLESRLVLTAAGPTVSDVTLSSTDWDSSFIDYLDRNSLGDGGYSVPVGDSSQLDPLPWNNLNQIRITFSENVSVQAADMSVSGVNVTAYAFSNFEYNPQSYTATWTLQQSFAGDRILLDLDGDGLDPVTNLAGDILDGEWSNGSSTYNSGNGVEGGDFEFRINALPGDVNQTGVVSVVDFSLTWQLNGKDTEDAQYDPMRDVDGSGNIDATDFFTVWGELFETLPIGDPAGTLDDAPTTQGFTNVSVYEDAVDTVLSLYDVFDDFEDLDSELDYEIVSNSNSALFAATTIDGDDLTLDFANDAYGIADLVVRATDSSGLIVDTTLHIDVTAVNDAPVVSSLLASLGLNDIWTFSGVVTDVDDDPVGWTVDFFGVLDGETAIVAADGTFELIVRLDPSVFGNAWVQTEDDEGLVSNLPVIFVGVT